MADIEHNQSDQSAKDEHAERAKATRKNAGLFKRPWARSAGGIVLAAALLAGAIAYRLTTSSVYIDTAVIEAPQIAIGPTSAGILQAVYVKPGDTVTAGESVAQVGTEALSAKVNGLVIATNDAPGQVFAPGQAVVTMIDPTQLRVVGSIDEDKGLSEIRVGDPVSFTVDAFGSRSFTGVVSEISPTSDTTSVVFNISDKRPTRQFDVKAAYDISAHPEFRNGMSAKMWVFPKK